MHIHSATGMSAAVWATTSAESGQGPESSEVRSNSEAAVEAALRKCANKSCCRDTLGRNRCKGPRGPVSCERNAVAGSQALTDESGEPLRDPAVPGKPEQSGDAGSRACQQAA